jgi:formyltetrahydrofolate synthetase
LRCLESTPEPEAALPSDTEIAQSTPLRRITELARERLAIAEQHLVPYGHHKAKISLPFIESLRPRPDGFSADEQLRGAPTGHVLPVRDVRLAAGAGFVVMICGDVLTLPGLPRAPAAEQIDLTDDGRIVGLG